MGLTPLCRRGVNPKHLTDKQQKFIQEYLIDFCGARAAKAAGYKHPAVAACKLLNAKRYPLVARAIGAARRRDLEDLALTRENILRELAYCLFRDPVDLCNKDGRIAINDLRELPPRVRRCIDGIKCKQYTLGDGTVVQEIELKLVGKLGCIEMAMKHKGLLGIEKHEVKMGVDWDSLLGSEEKTIDLTEQEIQTEEAKEQSDV